MTYYDEISVFKPLKKVWCFKSIPNMLDNVTKQVKKTKESKMIFL